MVSRVVELVGFALIVLALAMVSRPLAVGVAGVVCLLLAMGIEDREKKAAPRKRAGK